MWRSHSTAISGADEKEIYLAMFILMMMYVLLRISGNKFMEKTRIDLSRGDAAKLGIVSSAVLTETSLEMFPLAKSALLQYDTCTKKRMVAVQGYRKERERGDRLLLLAWLEIASKYALRGESALGGVTHGQMDFRSH